MNIEDAFTEEAIATLDTNVGGEEERELREVIKKIYVGNEINWANEHLNVAVLCFVAGRTYQTDLEAEQGHITVSMTPDTVSEFIEYLTRRGAS